ncbi:hypothetical protein HG421_13410 [Xanthomonas campestris pv. badrii]|uniref:Uncharacterized protein n=1 Tax=Xanthomonas campestris pv. badrii TaxID=149696 RepID=A0A7Z2VES5_XANCA|nr:hypothetical protein HG421_13410 [Xanthomonas campestris pv. badrii]
MARNYGLCGPAEACALADRIVVIEHGQVGLEVDVPVAHPRTSGMPALAATQAQVLSRLLGSGAGEAPMSAAEQGAVTPAASARAGGPLRRIG